MTLPPRENPGRTALPRRVLPEILDALPPDDPRAVRSRRDLRLVNRIMRARALLLRGLDSALPAPPRRLVEIGAGDGTLLLDVARKRARRWPGVQVTLLDLKPVVTNETLGAIRALGWSVEVLEADVLEALAGPLIERESVVFANLFVHHFEGHRLSKLLEGLAARVRAFVCCEPRRARVPLVGSHLLGLIGCNSVTRHDAVVSVHAGVRDRELSTAWLATSAGAAGSWRLTENAAGLFSQLFVAEMRT